MELSRRDFVRSCAAGAAIGWLGAGCGAERHRLDVWEELSDYLIRRIRRTGAEYGDVRIVYSTRQVVSGRDGRIERVDESFDRGYGIRVLYKGAWGFAASCVPTGDEAAATADLAAAIAKGAAEMRSDPVKLAPEPVHRDEVVTVARTDPFRVPLDEKAALLLEAMERMQRVDGIRRTSGRLWSQRDEKYFVSTEGSRLRFDLLAVSGEITATAVRDGGFATRTFVTPTLRTGWELVAEADLPGQAERVAREAVEKVSAPPVEPGRYDLVLDPSHLALTIHESCGHPTELDRALGYEANYAGTSFLTPDLLGKFRYGAPVVSLVADNTEEGCLASTGYDDDGVAGQRWDIVRDGIFVGYSDSREVAPKVGLARAHGSCRADGWQSMPIVRIANIGLEPKEGSLDDLLAGVERGLYIEGRGSYSIDQKRYNFQFGGDAFWLVENGRRTRMVRDVIYHGITPEFWGSCDAVAGPAARRRFGFITCGKGQPGQAGWMTHAAPPARFRQVEVIRGGGGA